MPKIINSNSFRNFALDKIEKNSGYNILLDNFNFKTNYNLKSIIKLKEIKILNKNKKQVLLLNDVVLSFKPFNYKPDNIKINYLYFDKTALEKNKKSNFDFNSLPKLSLNKAEIILQKNSSLTLYNIKGLKEEGHYSISFKGYIQSRYLSKNIQIKSNKNILIKNKSLIAHNAALVFNNSPLVIDGVLFNKGKFDFFLQGVDIPTQSIREAFLFYRKQIKPSEKNFMENFYDFKGTGSINLNFKNKAIFGYAQLDKFLFKSVKFDIPFYYPKSVFYFNKDEVSLKTHGLFNKEKLYTDYFGHRIFSKNRINEGTLISIATDALALEHLPDTRIIGTPDLKVKYIVQHRKPKVFYTLDLKHGEDISYKNISINSINKVRQFKANTIKIDNKLYLKNYTYFIENTPTIIGLGEFTKKNNKFHLDFITLDTVDFVPTKTLGKYSKYIEDGVFKASLKYIAVDKDFFGNINFKINNIIFNKLKLKNIDITADIKNNHINFILQNAMFYKPFNDFLFNDGSKLKKILSKKDLAKIRGLDVPIFGNFNLDIENKLIDNIEIYNQNKFLSAFLEGCYKLKTKETSLNLWAGYNKKEYKKIKLFYIIPMHWLTNFIFKKEFSSKIYQKQIEKIPPIEAAPCLTEVVLINIEGNINDSSNLKFKLKSIE